MSLTVCGALAVTVAALAPLPAGAQISGQFRPHYDRVQGQIQMLRRSAIPGADPRQLSGGVGSMMGSFQAFYPMVPSFAPGDYQANQQLLRDAMAALAAVESVAGLDPGLRSTVANAYGNLGDYQSRQEFRNYGYNPAYAYGRAGGLARGLVLNGGTGKNFEKDVERYAMSMATWNLVNGQLMNGMYGGRQQAAEQPLAAPVQSVKIEPLATPMIDPASLNDQGRAIWDELRPQFTSTAKRVAASLSSLESLNARLKQQGMAVNAADLATGYQMQGFLEDSAGLIQAKNFDEAKLALERAEHLRMRLKRVTGE